jgi:hypothetical protein
MTISTLMVLLLLTFGQILALSIGFLVLWLAGEFDEETDAHRRYSGQRASALMARRISETRTAVMLRWQRLLRFNWMRGYRPFIAGCVLVLVAVGISIGVGKLKPWQIAHFLPQSLTDGSKPASR